MQAFQTSKLRSGRGGVKNVPAAPTGLTATPVSSTSIVLDWNDNSGSAVTGYKVYRSLTSGSGFSLVSSPSVSYYADTVIEGTTYYYKVLAYNASGDSAFTAEVSATSQSDYTPPAWTIADLPGVDATFGGTKGGTVPLTSIYAANDGTPYFTISTITAAGGSDTSGITINSATGEISVDINTPADSYTVRVGLDSSGIDQAALADWTTRSTGSGVLWAHRFAGNSEPGLWWGQSISEHWGTQYTDNNSPPGRVGYLGAPASGYTQTYNGWTRSEAGIIGDGCLEFYCPAGTGPAQKWERPLAPVLASPSNGVYVSYPANDRGCTNPLITAPLDMGWFYTGTPGHALSKLGNGGGGLFANVYEKTNSNRVSQTNGTAFPAGVQEIVYSGGFYIQFRVKFKTMPNGKNRLDDVFPAGKLAMLANISHGNPDNEIVMNTGGYGTIGAAPFAYAYTYRDPLLGTGGTYPSDTGRILEQLNCTNYQPNATAPYGPGNYWKWTDHKDEWITVLIYVNPGRENSYNPSGDYALWLRQNATHFDTHLRIKVAVSGATSWTTVHDYNAYAIMYGLLNGGALYKGNVATYSVFGGQGSSASQQNSGWSQFSLNLYSNPAGALPGVYTEDMWVLYDQLICSTAEIPLPVK